MYRYYADDGSGQQHIKEIKGEYEINPSWCVIQCYCESRLKPFTKLACNGIKMSHLLHLFHQIHPVYED